MSGGCLLCSLCCINITFLCYECAANANVCENVILDTF